MKKFLFILMVPFILNSSEILKTDDLGNNREMRIVKFDNHTYVFFRNYWCADSERFIHDPSCQCRQKNKKEE